jgi:hypothetical protein
VLFILLLSAGCFSGDVRAYAASPDGRYFAEWREYPTHSATTPNTDTVQLSTRFNPFRHTVLIGAFGVRPTVSWIDARNVLIDCDGCCNFELHCDGCQLFRVDFKETEWHEVIVHYGIPKPLCPKPLSKE